MFESIAAKERKGDWEREVATTRYTKSHLFGIFVVGWFRISDGDTGVVYSNNRWVLVEKCSVRGLRVSDNILRS